MLGHELQRRRFPNSGGERLSEHWFTTQAQAQNCAHDYRRLLRANGLIASMSKKGDCYDNAAMESWNHSLKVEAIHGERFSTRQDAKKPVFEYIEIYYNRKRLHSSLGYLSPEAFEQRHVA
jgi:transposase InsO family protein